MKFQYLVCNQCNIARFKNLKKIEINHVIDMDDNYILHIKN